MNNDDFAPNDDNFDPDAVPPEEDDDELDADAIPGVADPLAGEVEDEEETENIDDLAAEELDVEDPYDDINDQ